MDSLEGNEEIQAALKEFEEKSVPIHQLKEEPVASFGKPSRMSQLVMKIFGGIIKDEKQADYVLLAFVVVALAITLYLFWGQAFPSQSQIKVAPIE